MPKQANRKVTSVTLASVLALCGAVTSCTDNSNDGSPDSSGAGGARQAETTTKTGIGGAVGSTGTGGAPASPNKGGSAGTLPANTGAVGGMHASGGSGNMGVGASDVGAVGGASRGGSLGQGGIPNTGGKASAAGAGVGNGISKGGALNTSSSTGGKSIGGNAAKGGAANTSGNVPAAGKGGGLNVTAGGSVAFAGANSAGGRGGSSAIDVGGRSAGNSAILEPESGALLGLYYGDASLAATTTKLGRAAPIHLTYYAWEDEWAGSITQADLRAGRIPFVNWELFGGNLDDIVAGKNDAMITERAVAAKNLGGKLFLDFGAEMNGDWSPWSGAENGKSSAKFVAAYRHVHDQFVASGATNVIWAFCPNVTSVPDAAWNEPLDYYPGDSYVDWTCVDGYNWGTSESGDGWQSFYEVFKDIYAILATKNKPIIIGEMASTELGGNKAEWIAQIVPTLKTDFPLIKGLIWFDINKETDWRISSSAASEAAFKTMANDPWFAQ